MPPKVQCADWIDWRADHPSRDHGHTRPVAPTLLRAPSLTEPLAGALPQAELEVFYYELSPHQHLSDLHRVRCLAETHPQIESVRIHKAGKQYDPSDFNVYGRAKSYRQAPFDLAIELAASGALIHVGIHTNKINRKNLPQQGQPPGLIAYWWMAVHGPLQEAEAERAQAVWWDICEIDHKIPPSPLGPVYRELAAAAAASGPEPAASSGLPQSGRAPASGGQAAAPEPSGFIRGGGKGNGKGGAPGRAKRSARWPLSACSPCPLCHRACSAHAKNPAEAYCSHGLPHMGIHEWTPSWAVVVEDGARKGSGGRGEMCLAPPVLQHAQFLAEVGKAGDANFPLVASPRVEECQLSGAILGGHSRRERRSVSPMPVHSG